MKTKVIFRIWPKSQGGDVIALFPALAGDDHAYTCQSYQHTGQHSAADLVGLGRKLRLATRKEFAPLVKELRGLGYSLDIRQRATQADRRERERQLAR